MSLTGRDLTRIRDVVRKEIHEEAVSLRKWTNERLNELEGRTNERLGGLEKEVRDGFRRVETRLETLEQGQFKTMGLIRALDERQKRQRSSGGAPERLKMAAKGES